MYIYIYNYKVNNEVKIHFLIHVSESAEPYVINAEMNNLFTHGEPNFPPI